MPGKGTETGVDSHGKQARKRPGKEGSKKGRKWMREGMKKVRLSRGVGASEFGSMLQICNFPPNRRTAHSVELEDQQGQGVMKSRVEREGVFSILRKTVRRFDGKSEKDCTDLLVRKNEKRGQKVPRMLENTAKWSFTFHTQFSPLLAPC
jgi:hypothetical protein